MKITFLGTGAADWVAGEKNENGEYRRNSSALIDDVLLIDPGPDVLGALKAFGKSPDAIKYIINTHKHSDHYCEETVRNLKNAHFYDIKEQESVEAGVYTVDAYRANHSTCESAVHFMISDGKSKLFYGLDGAWLMYDEANAITATDVDFAVFDATIGNVPGDYRIFEHNNLDMVLEMKKTLAGHVKRYCISHMARTLHGSQTEIEKMMSKYDVEVAYDGYETEF